MFNCQNVISKIIMDEHEHEHKERKKETNKHIYKKEREIATNLIEFLQ